MINRHYKCGCTIQNVTMNRCPMHEEAELIVDIIDNHESGGGDDPCEACRGMSSEIDCDNCIHGL